jgi:hypothetical protein
MDYGKRNLVTMTNHAQTLVQNIIYGPNLHKICPAKHLHYEAATIKIRECCQLHFQQYYVPPKRG